MNIVGKHTNMNEESVNDVTGLYKHKGFSQQNLKSLKLTKERCK